MAWAADTIACRPLPHNRLSVRAGVSTGRPPLMAATRARYMSWTSVWMTLPKTTCPTASGGIPARLTASRTTAAPSSVGGLSFKPPPKSPIAVRTPLKTTTSACVMFFLLLLLYLTELLLHKRSAVDVESRACDVISIHNEVANTTGYLLWGADPTERDAGQHALLHLVGHTFPHVRPYPSRTDDVDCHVVASQLQGSGFGEPDDAGLGRAIVGLAKARYEGVHRTDVDDLDALLLYKIGQCGFHRVETATQVVLNHLVPVLWSEILHRAIDVDTCIID